MEMTQQQMNNTSELLEEDIQLESPHKEEVNNE